MQRIQLITGLLLAFSLTNLSAGQEDTGQQEEKKKASNIAMVIELRTMILTKTYERAGLDADQRKKLAGIINSSVSVLALDGDKLSNMLTADERRKYKAAVKAANDARYSPQEAVDYAFRKLKLSAEKLAEYKALEKRIAETDKRMNDEIAAILTDEQKAKLKMFGGNQKKSSAISFKLPNMKSDENAAAIWTELRKIKGAADFKSDLENQTVTFKVPAGTNVNKTMTALAGGNELFKDWELKRAKKTGSDSKGSQAEGSGSKGGAIKPRAGSGSGSK